MPVSAQLHRQLRPMPPEPWGRKLKRARWDLNRFSLDDAVRLAGQFMLTSTGSISRLEDRGDEPTGPRSTRNRQLAYLLCLAYGVEPGDFGLDPSDLPPGITVPRRTVNRHGRGSSTIWYSDDAVAGMSLLLAA